jgi:hypothetical protein
MKRVTVIRQQAAAPVEVSDRLVEYVVARDDAWRSAIAQLGRDLHQMSQKASNFEKTRAYANAARMVETLAVTGADR